MATVVANVETLTASLLAETKARTSADTALTASLNAETKARTVGHSALKARVDAESKARTTADTAVTKQLKPLKSLDGEWTNSLLRKLTTLPFPGKGVSKTYIWHDLFHKLFTEGRENNNEAVFVSGATYMLTATSSNGVHSHTYTMHLRIGGTTYREVKYR